MVDTHDILMKMHPLFFLREIRPGVFLIGEKFFHSWNLANIFFIKGTNSNALIDTGKSSSLMPCFPNEFKTFSGTGIHDLPRFLRWSGLLDHKHLHVILTHTHFDHSGGLHQFLAPQTSIHVHEQEKSFVTSNIGFDMTCAWVTDDEVMPKPSKDWKGKKYEVKRISPDDISPLQNGDVFHLGNRKLEVN